MLYSMSMEVREQLTGVSSCFYAIDPGIPLSEGLAAAPSPAELFRMTENS